jgi:uncharacterized membrane protein YczE
MGVVSDMKVDIGEDTRVDIMVDIISYWVLRRQIIEFGINLTIMGIKVPLFICFNIVSPPQVRFFIAIIKFFSRNLMGFGTAIRFIILIVAVVINKDELDCERLFMYSNDSNMLE